MEIGRWSCVVVVDEKQTRARRRQGVDGELGLRRGAALMLGDVVDDEESTGTVGEAWGGVNRRRRGATVAAGSGQIPARGRLIEEGKVLRRIRGMRATCWCERFERGSSLFIGG
jgi:hypothetical protein